MIPAPGPDINTIVHFAHVDSSEARVALAMFRETFDGDAVSHRRRPFKLMPERTAK